MGEQGELVVINFLKKHNYKILRKNWRIKSGEIDIVAIENKTLVFCEVKTRKLVPKSYYSPLDSVTHKKMQKLSYLISNFKKSNRILLKNLKLNDYRLDLFAVWKQNISSWWIEHQVDVS